MIGEMFLARDGRVVVAGDAMIVVSTDSEMIPVSGGNGTLPEGATVRIVEMLNPGTGLVLADDGAAQWWLKPHECLMHAPNGSSAARALSRAVQQLIRTERDAPGLTLLQFIIAAVLQERAHGIGVKAMADAIGVQRAEVEAAVAGMPQLVRNWAADRSKPCRTLHATALCRRWVAKTSGGAA